MSDVGDDPDDDEVVEVPGIEEWIADETDAERREGGTSDE